MIYLWDDTAFEEYMYPHGRMTPEAKFSGLYLHFECIWTQMTPEPKFRELDLQFETIGS